MKIHTLHIEGLLVIEPTIFTDSRGYFFESFSEKWFSSRGLDYAFVQDNQSLSQKGTVRGLHFQAPPHAQGKLVRVVQGAVLDVALDIRKGSPTYGQYFAIELTAQNHTQFWVPPGFAHGFSTLEDNTIFQYKCTNYYNKASEGGVLWCDPELGINWQVNVPIVSDKDKVLPTLAQLETPF
ncbi:MAG: dTDP-4-dehydrorhamnose 3,5-epimerase [Bacteroidia bacterium]|nr:dTDP-4-dehydrorhamnose 3,5-epimerase [Bacteroidia bacterium]